MPYVNVTIAAGRTAEAKKKLLESVSQAVHESIDAPLESVRVWITEVPAEDMSIGGVPISVLRTKASR